MTQPFEYPAIAHIRRHGPMGYADYASFRPWLRDEFEFRCVYCLVREQWTRVTAHFALDHFLPVARYPERTTDYNNLLYVCSACNVLKKDKILADPLQILIAPDVRVTKDGTLVGNTQQAQELIEQLLLNSTHLIDQRLLWIDIVSLAAQYNVELYRRLMRYPDDLPDLSRLQPPDGNSRPEGIASSAFERRRQGELPVVY